MSTCIYEDVFSELIFRFSLTPNHYRSDTNPIYNASPQEHEQWQN
jgi:hypothetical protein